MHYCSAHVSTKPESQSKIPFNSTAILITNSIYSFSRSEEHKNGHKLSSSRLSSFLDAEYDQEGLKGARATSHRRLPDLPDPLLNGTDNSIGRIGSVRSSQDTSSELYAQVEIGIANNSCKPIKITRKKKKNSICLMSGYSQ